MPYSSLTEREMLEQLLRIKNSSEETVKIESNKLDHQITNIKENQEKFNDLLTLTSDRLLDPVNGLFAKVANVNNKVEQMASNVSKIEQFNQSLNSVSIQVSALDVQVNKIDGLHNELQELKKLADNNEEAIKSIKRAAGEDFEELRGVITTKKSLAKLYWSLLGSIIMSMSSAVYILIKNLH